MKNPPSASDRLASLERRSRLQTAALAALGLLLLAGAAAPRAATTDVVRARALQLLDAEDHVRAELTIDEEGSAGLFLRDAEGRVRGTLIHDDSQSALYFLDAEGTIRVGAAQYAHGGGGFALHGPESKGGAVLYLEKRGSLRFFAEDGSVLHEVPEKD